ncbi:hypothetical protein CPB86DRAFT_870121 [Serendipita vermifera]|nr:hypothetical protein CPB86DRAFT_870121 [Serendipita vermifera]
MAQRAGGLYGGIRFLSSSALPQDNIQPSSSSIVSKPIAEKAPAKEPAPVTPEVTQEKQEIVETAAPEASTKSSAGWSASLAFAPVRRSNKPKPSTNRLPPGAAFVASLATAATTTAPQIAPVTAPADQEPNEPEVSGWGKKIKAPSMVLDDDINGFRRIQPGEGKRKKKKNINANQLLWDPFEQYDPFHPNDYQEYKNWKKKEREERRVQERRRVEELKRRREGDWSEYSSENDSEDGRPSRKTARYHSPERDEERPMGLGMARAPADMETDDHQSAYRPPTPPNQVAAAQVATGEEAYLRRLQMSRGFVRQSSPPEAPPSFIDSSHSTPEQTHAPPPISPLPLPTFVPPSQPDRDEHPIPQPEEAHSSPLAPFTAPPAVSSSSLTQEVIEEKRKAAAAIAARLSALSKIQGSPVAPVPVPPQNEIGQQPAPVKGDQGSFAERYMAKLGHVAGQGLGARGDGIVEPIMLERALGPKTGKKGGETEDGKPKKPGAGGMGFGGAKMGKIVNSQAEEKKEADLAKFGESSRIVVLTNIVSREDVDEDLQGEIGDECSKHGTVERVLVHMPEHPVDEGDAVRIFVQFSGPAGAWKAVRDLDGRFFGGRTVRARYFDEVKFARRLFDLPLL